MDLLTACKMAYRKHHLNDESIGWEELSEALLDALCNAMGDDGYQAWIASLNDVPLNPINLPEPAEAERCQCPIGSLCEFFEKENEVCLYGKI